MPRILRSPGSKSFRLENVSVPNADGARCERRRHPRRPKAKSALGQKLTSSSESSMSVLPLEADIHQGDGYVSFVPITAFRNPGGTRRRIALTHLTIA